MSVVLSKYELNPTFNENVMTIKAKLASQDHTKVKAMSKYPTFQLGHRS